MAQFTGYVCDVCERVGRNREGWMKLEPSSGGHFDICSDKCLLKLARSRAKGDAPERPIDPYRAEVIAYANETSVREAADRYGISWQQVARWRSDS